MNPWIARRAHEAANLTFDVKGGRRADLEALPLAL
jgi:hypothetical protein